MEIACVLRAVATGKQELMQARWIPCHDCGVHVVSISERLGSQASPTPYKGGALIKGWMTFALFLVRLKVK
jgi:hypothetical protein